jgi:TRAP-type C4-dicarboxylate transport system substrate-binding protein
MKGRYFFAFTGFIFILFTLTLINFQPAQAQTINLKFAHIFPQPNPLSKICEAFLEELEVKSGGRIKSRYFAGGSLLKPDGISKGIETGIADIGFAHVEYTPGRFPVTEVCDLPLGYPDGWVANHVADDFYNKFKPKEWDNIKVLWMHTSTPNVMITTKPVRKLEDLKGMTIRAPGRVGDTVSALGASPAPMPIMEVYDGLAKGVIQGVNIPYETLKAFRFAEVAKYTTVTWEVGNLYTFYVIMNKRSYEKLTGDLKEIFDKLCGIYKERMAMVWNSVDFDGLEFGLEKGVEIIHLSDQELARWKKATESVIQGYIKDMKSKGFSEAEIKGWMDYIKERIEYWTKVQVQYRLKSPTGPPEVRP